MRIVTLQNLDHWQGQTSEERELVKVFLAEAFDLFQTTLQDVLWMMSVTSFYETSY